MPNVQTNQCEPILEWHIPTNLTTRAIQIIWSGGSYVGNTPNGFEVAPARRYLNEKGMTVVTVRYRTPRPAAPLAKHVTAWQDVQRAIRLVRSQAAERGLDPDRIGVMGSSAGGHLALMAATSSRHKAYRSIDKLDQTVSCAVQWAVCIYPAYALTDGLEHGNAKGGNDLDVRLAPEFSFDPDTPPMLFVHGDADSWAAMNSVVAWEQLRRMGIQGELHTLVKRGHCFQASASPGTGSYTYLDRIREFLADKGFDR
jgi:acetyl esterase/lipase